MLTEDDKKAIKKAILKAVENGCADPENLVYRCINSLEKVNSYDTAKKGELGSTYAIADGYNCHAHQD